MQLEKTIELLRQQLKVLREDPSTRKFYGGTFRAWARNVEAVLIRGLGDPGIRLLVQFDRATASLPLPQNLIDPGGSERRWQFLFESKLPEVEAMVEGIICELETFGLPDARIEAQISGERPKVFIAHCGVAPSLSKVRDFLKDLDVEPIIVEDKPSSGMALDDKVPFYLGKADCMIALATSDEGQARTCQNVIHEIGLAQGRFPNRIIYFLEEGVEYPSNVDPKVWERFNQENLENVFCRIAKELRAMGIIQPVKPE